MDVIDFSRLFQVSRGPPERLERLLEACLALLDLSWVLLGPLGALEALLEASWTSLGGLPERALGPSWSDLEPVKPDIVVGPESISCKHLLASRCMVRSLLASRFTLRPLPKLLQNCCNHVLRSSLWGPSGPRARRYTGLALGASN